jgi:hypothetical protein
MYRFDMYVFDNVIPSIYWNIQNTLGPGDSGNDVRLVQYLLNYSELGSLAVGDTHLIEVDGIWGRETSNAVSRLESDPNYASIADGKISPIPQSTFKVGSHFSTIYKLVILHWRYAYTRTGLSSSTIGMEEMNNVVLGMPENFDCPPELSFALRAARGY